MVDKSAIKYKVAIVALLSVIAGIFLVSPPSFGDRARAEQNILDIYKLVAGPSAEIIKTTEQNGLYRISIRFKDSTGRDTVQDVFVTKDGALITGVLVDLQLQKSLLTNQSAFAQCLFDRNVRVLGLADDQATQLQLQVLGAFSGRIYVDCSGQNLALCQQLNIQAVPVVFYNNSLYQGPLTPKWFFDNVGCAMTETGTV